MMEIVVGTYEELIIAYKVTKTKEGYDFALKFTDHSHTGCIRTVAISKRGILATGSSDEVIRLFNIKKHFEIGSLMHHKGVISGLTFYGKTHMFSTSHDGTIGVWQVGKWECLRTLRGHKGAVTCVSVHPSGKMALSVSKDKTLRVWNLMTGKCAYVTALKQVADIVLWSPGGNSYIVVTNSKADVYDVETAKISHTISMTGRIQDVKFIDAETLILGGEEGKVQLHNVHAKSKLLEFSTDTNRVKALCLCQSVTDANTITLTTASSDGFIKLWTLTHDQDDPTVWSHTAEGQLQTKFRITAAAMFSSGSASQQPQKRARTEEACSTPKEKRLKTQEHARANKEIISVGQQNTPTSKKSEHQPKGKMPAGSPAKSNSGKLSKNGKRKKSSSLHLSKPRQIQTPETSQHDSPQKQVKRSSSGTSAKAKTVPSASKKQKLKKFKQKKH